MSRPFVAIVAVAVAGLVSGCAACRLSPGPPPKPATAPVAALAAPPAPPPKTVLVRVPTAVSCIPEDLGAAPAYPDTNEALRDAGGAADRYQLLAAGRLLREARLRRLEEVVKHCRKLTR